MADKRQGPGSKDGGRAADAGPLAQLQELYRFMVEQKLESLEYDHDGLRVRLVRQRPAAVPVPVPVATHPAASAPPVAAASGPGPYPAPAGPATPAGSLTVKSPMMGIFYRAASPSSPPFAKTGDQVKKGQVLCLIEAMKVFNEVKAEFDATVTALLVENGKPVKAGQDLFAVERR